MSIDYKSFEPGIYGTNAETTGQAGFWWKLEGDISQAVVRAAQHIDQQQQYRTSDNLRHARLYGNHDTRGFGPRDYARTIAAASNISRIALNAIGSCVDTLAAKTFKNRPRPTFQTFGAEWKLQRKALKLDKFCQGLFHEAKVYEHTSMAGRDAEIFGTGAVKVFEHEGRVCVERTLIEELKVDDADGLYGAPRQLIQFKSVAREVLMDMFGDTPEKRELIARAPCVETDEGAARGFGDLVQVYEAWHLPSGEKTKDGRHAIVCANVTLLDEEWTKPYFPFAFIRYVRRVAGFWGQGIPERLFGIQLEINRLIREIAETMRLMSKGRVLVENGSKVVKSHLNSEVGTIVTYQGQPPVIWNANAVPAEQFNQLDRLWQRAFEQEGISMMSAAAQKPAGLNSGKALREHEDIEDGRHILFGQSYEQMHLDIARIAIDTVRTIAKRDGDYKVNAPIRRVLEPYDWKDVDLSEDNYQMQVFPTSSLPTTPAARMEQVVEWINMGWVDAVEGRRLMNMPDLEQSDSLSVAALDDADAMIEDILDGGEARAPDQFQNWTLLLARGTSALLRARLQKAPPEVLKALEDFLAVTQQKKAATEPRPMAPAGPPALPPEAVGAMSAPVGPPADPSGMPMPAMPPI